MWRVGFFLLTFWISGQVFNREMEMDVLKLTFVGFLFNLLNFVIFSSIGRWENGFLILSRWNSFTSTKMQRGVKGSIEAVDSPKM